MELTDGALRARPISPGTAVPGHSRHYSSAMWRRRAAMLPRIAVCLMFGAVTVLPTRADEALVAVAANFAEVVQELKPAFEKASGHKLQPTTGSTGKLYAQIKEGAPFHILLSADAKTPERLEEEKAGVAGTRFTYAVGKLTLWSSDPGRIGSDGAAALKAGDVRHIAIANPDLAPYGVAARETLQSLGLWDSLKTKIVMGQNIGQTHSMVATGNAQLGFIALSAVLGPRESAKGSRWDVPQNLFKPIRQDAVLLSAGARNEAAIAFLKFLKTPEARTVIDRYGYGIE
jgi:molybdate transport system substrate-binding protein